MGAERGPAPTRAGPWHGAILHGLIVVAVCAAVYLPWLGRGGLTSTEGHRAIPGWGMLESGDWVLPRMFGRVYLRKPPGVPWAIAASSRVFGETEFAARLPSALAMMGMSLVAMVFARRWFGRGAGLVAGLATALTPWFWSSGRSAEIEAINNFGTCAAVLLVIELMVNRAGRRWWGTLIVAGLLGEAVLLTGLAKGPAGFAAIGGAVVAGFVWTGTDRSEQRSVARVRAGLWLAVAVLPAAAVLCALYVRVMGETARVKQETGLGPVVQDVTEFLWSWSGLTAVRVARVLALGPVGLRAGWPGSLGLALVWGKRVDAERSVGERSGLQEGRIARAVAGACLLSLVALTIAGVGNPRYAMPSVCFLPVLAGYAWTTLGRTSLVRWTGIGLVGALLISAAVWIGVLEPRERARSGRDAGVSLGAALPDGAMVWADGMVEARPEVLWYAQREAARSGRKVQPVWITRMAELLVLPRHGYLLMRTDSLMDEARAYREAGFMDRLTPVWEGRVHKYSCTLYRKE